MNGHRNGALLNFMVPGKEVGRADVWGVAGSGSECHSSFTKPLQRVAAAGSHLFSTTQLFNNSGAVSEVAVSPQIKDIFTFLCWVSLFTRRRSDLRWKVGSEFGDTPGFS